MRVSNPYRPGFNQAPAVLAGRDGVLAAVGEALAVAAEDARTPRPILLTGGRGVGKTVILGEAAAMAAELRSWLTVAVEVRPHSRFTAQLGERLTRAAELYEQSAPRGKFQVKTTKLHAGGFGMAADVEIGRQEQPASALPLEAALSSALTAAAAKSAGLLVTIDEVHLATRDELADLAATLQQLVPADWPLVVILAGLPSMRDPRRNVTYLERAEWHELGLLGAAAAREALAGPAAGAGRPMDDDAVEILATAAGGYPYAIQLLGHYAWRASQGAGRITAEHARQALPAAESDLAAGLYASRWADAAEREREYLTALAHLLAEGRPTGGGDVARALGQKPSKVSYLRDRLLKKGSIFVAAGQLQFPVPGMADWIIARDAAAP